MGEREEELQGDGQTPPADHDKPIESDWVLKERDIFRRRAKHRGIILVGFVCAVILILLGQALLSELAITPSDRRILTANDIGPGWNASKPEADIGTGMSDSAIVFLSFNGTQIEGTCTLDSFSTTELANTSYDLEYENISGDLKQNGPVNVTVGDRASIIYWSSSDPPHEIWEESVIMQKGKWISSITLTGRLGPGFETSQILRIAQIQAAKLS